MIHNIMSKSNLMKLCFADDFAITWCYYLIIIVTKTRRQSNFNFFRQVSILANNPDFDRSPKGGQFPIGRMHSPSLFCTPKQWKVIHKHINKLKVVAPTYIAVFRKRSIFLSVCLHILCIPQ